MFTGIVNTRVKLFTAPGSGIETGKVLIKGMIVVGDKITNTWLHVTSPNEGWANSIGGAITVTTQPDPPPPPVNPPPGIIPHKLAIVKFLYPGLTVAGNWEVNAVEMGDQDIPIKFGKGGTIIWYPSAQTYMRKLNTVDGYHLAVTPRHLITNRGWVGDPLGSTLESGADPYMKAECIHGGYGNIVQILQQVNSRNGIWNEIKAFHNQTDFSAYNAAEKNWFYNPSEFWKESTRNKMGEIGLPGDGDHIYYPIIKQTAHVWIHESFLEYFPSLPAGGVGYVLFGTCVYMQTATGLKPLRLNRNKSELVHPDPSWKLNTRPMVTEVRPEWVYPTTV